MTRLSPALQSDRPSGVADRVPPLCQRCGPDHDGATGLWDHLRSTPGTERLARRCALSHRRSGEHWCVLETGLPRADRDRIGAHRPCPRAAAPPGPQDQPRRACRAAGLSAHFFLLCFSMAKVTWCHDGEHPRPHAGYGLISYRLLNGLSNGTRRILLKPASVHSSRTFGSWKPRVPSPRPPPASEVVMQ